MLRKNFDISDDPWWKPKYCDSQGVEELEKRIKQLKREIEDRKKQDEIKEDDWDDYKEYQYEKYLFECMTGECNADLEFQDVRILKENDFKNHRLCRKLVNLDKAVRELFPDVFNYLSEERLSLTDFNVEYVKSVHRKIGQGVISNPGIFRKKSAKPAREFQFYLEPHLIEATLEQLLRECRAVFSNAELSSNGKLPLLDAVKYSACFLERFLFIHPFSNGNGRTARLLLSRLLACHTIIPLSLCTSRSKREVYLDCIREARCDFGNRPYSLARFILESILVEYETCYYVMALDLTENEQADLAYIHVQ